MDPGERGRLVSHSYLSCEREQQYVMPVSLSDWLPEDHFAWFVLEAVGQARPYCELFPGRLSCRRQLRISGAPQTPLGSSPRAWTSDFLTFVTFIPH